MHEHCDKNIGTKNVKRIGVFSSEKEYSSSYQRTAAKILE